MIDGVRTALIVINDVRSGDVVEASTPSKATTPSSMADSRRCQLADGVPIDRLHWRLEAPLKA